jgi:cell division protein FtsI (penicillin-binding protein 3)
MSGKRERRVKRLKREEQARPSYVGRRRAVLAVFALSATFLVWRAVDRQILEKDFLQSEGADRYLDVVEMPAHRGLITDRHGAVLAVSTPVDSLGADPRVFRPDSRTLAALARILELDPDDVRRRLAENSHRRFVFLQRKLTPAQAEAVSALVRDQGIRGLRLEREYRRYYPAGEVFAHVIGYTGADDQGQEGLELSFDRELAGVPGAKRVLRDGRRQVVADVESIRLPASGKNLALSIDRRLQYLAYRELKAAVRKHRARAGSAVLLDVRTGEVLAMVNQPAFNPNGSRSNLRGKRRNRAVTDVFEPGSTMKPFAVAAAVDLGAYPADARIDTAPGYFYVGRDRVRDHHDLGEIDLETVLVKSSNVGVGKIALDLPKEAFWAYLARLGFGVEAGVGFPGEVGGHLLHPSRWSRIDQATLAFGYGISVTALQLAQAYQVLAADGERRPATLLRQAGVVRGEQVLKPASARAVRHMLEGVVSLDGTAPAAAVPGYRVAGKTGTAKKVGADGYSDERYLALFAGVAPASEPRLAFVVVIDEPRGEKYYGGDVAAPVFARVVGDALRILNVAPDALPEGASRLAQAGGGK